MPIIAWMTKLRGVYMNSYSELLKLMQIHGSKNNPDTVELATVISVSPNLVIQTEDVQITNSNILIADYLLSTYMRQVKIPPTSNVSSTVTNNNSVTSIGLSGQIDFTDTLNVGDQLAVQAIQDGQMYLILCRVVSLDG
jgi:hypothetical protein